MNPFAYLRERPTRKLLAQLEEQSRSSERRARDRKPILAGGRP